MCVFSTQTYGFEQDASVIGLRDSITGKGIEFSELYGPEVNCYESFYL
jgi:hypothetical protein